MILQEPKLEFVQIIHNDCIATTGSGYTICERIAGTNISIGEWCQYYSDTSTSWINTCGDFCDKSSVTCSAACQVIGVDAND